MLVAALTLLLLPLSFLLGLVILPLVTLLFLCCSPFLLLGSLIVGSGYVSQKIIDFLTPKSPLTNERGSLYVASSVLLPILISPLVLLPAVLFTLVVGLTIMSCALGYTVYKASYTPAKYIVNKIEKHLSEDYISYVPVSHDNEQRMKSPLPKKSASLSPPSRKVALSQVESKKPPPHPNQQRSAMFFKVKTLRRPSNNGISTGLGNSLELK